MSIKHRTYYRDKFCLNCGYPITSNYCSECGQKAHLHKDSFWHMAIHFIGDYLHYDGKFWTTIKTMIMHPGQITLDYINGKRVKHLGPIPLYIFITSIFFIITPHLGSEKKDSDHKSQTPAAASLTDHVKDTSPVAKTDTTDLAQADDESQNSTVIDFGIAEKSIEQYDSIQAQLEPTKRDPMIERFLHRKLIQLQHHDHFGEDFSHGLQKNIPKALFILLPFFALLSKIIFYKNRRLYVDHLVFSMHIHTVAFSMLLLLSLLSAITGFGGLLLVITNIMFGIYLLLSLRRVYHGSFGMIFFKQTLLFFGYLTGLIFVLLLLSLYTLFTL